MVLGVPARFPLWLGDRGRGYGTSYPLIIVGVDVRIDTEGGRGDGSWPVIQESLGEGGDEGGPAFLLDVFDLAEFRAVRGGIVLVGVCVVKEGREV